MPDISRRNVLRAALAGAVTAGAGTASLLAIRQRETPAHPHVVISGWGGATQRAMRRAYFEPFTRETGIEVIEETYGGQGLARLNAQMMEGRVRIDLLDSAPFWASIGCQQGILDRIALPDTDAGHFIPGAIDDHSFGYSTVSWGIAYLRRDGAEPAGWRDFWDVDAFPGRRAFFGPFVARHPEYALLADGYAMGEVYPLNDAKIELAFSKLEEIKPHIRLWYQTAAQCEQLLTARQMDFVEFFNGRVFHLQELGVPVEFQWNEAIMNTSVFVLARDAPNRDNALKFLSYISRPEPQAEFAKLISHGPTNLRALNLISDERTLERLPTFGANYSRQLLLDAHWWGENEHRFAPRWNQFVSR